MKAGNRVYFLVNRSVQLVARNREYPNGLNNVPCVVWSCIKMHATYEIVNYALRLIIHATSCTLRHRELRIEVNHSCNKLHATRERSIRIAYGFYSQTLGGYNKSAVRF